MSGLVESCTELNDARILQGEQHVVPAPRASAAEAHGRAGEPGLTVVILTYNSAATIGACLESLVGQKYQDFDVVVVDDDSTDDTLPIVGGYSSSLPLLVVRNGSHIIPRGRNIGIAASKTDLIAFVDSDDSAEPGWTKTIIETFQQNPGIAMISGDLVQAYRTTTARAIAMNDDAIRGSSAAG